jgi:hypothetical protein
VEYESGEQCRYGDTVVVIRLGDGVQFEVVLLLGDKRYVSMTGGQDVKSETFSLVVVQTQIQNFTEPRYSIDG